MCDISQMLITYFVQKVIQHRQHIPEYIQLFLVNLER